MNKEKIEYYSHLTVAIVGAVIFGYVFLCYLLPALLPFFIAWTVAFATRPLAYKIAEGTHISYKVIRVLLTTLIVLGGITVLVSALAYAAREAWDFISGLNESGELYDVLSKLMNPIGGWLGERDGAAELEGEIGEAVKGMLSSLLGGIAEALSSFITSIPGVLLFTLVCVVASIYFALDLENINAFVRRSLPRGISSWLVNFKNRFLDGVFKYIRSYIILMIITFVILLFGFLVIGVDYAVLLGFLIALLDALPLFGVGTVLVPWSVYHLFFGNTGMGVALLVLFLICQLTRQFAEPKIVGKSLGISPIVSLVLLYAGYYFFGFLGLVFVPLFSVLINILINKNNSSQVA